MPMTDDELNTVVKSQLGDTIKFADSTFKEFNLELLRRYNLEDYGNEEDGRSQVQSSDVFDTVESDMPSLTRIFQGANKVMQFSPYGEEDAEEAQQKTAYADFLIRGQRDSYKTVNGWMKESGISQASILYFFIEETEKPEYVRYENLNDDELQQTMNSLESEDKVDRVEIDSQEETEGKRFNIRFKVVKKTQKISLVPVPSESFVITRGSADKDTATMVGHISLKSKGDLIAEGHDKEFVKGLPLSGDSDDTTKEERFREQGGFDLETGYHWTNDKVQVQTLYPLVDYDEDGIPERRYVLRIANQIVENEPFGIVPYALLSQILMPHAAIGKTRGEQAARYQKEKTAIRRGIMDNIYAVNRPRNAVDDSSGSIDGGKVDLDDMLSHQIDGLVRTDGDPRQAIMPLTVPYIGGSALEVVQYLDTAKSQALGVMLANQGLQADQLYKETATRFEGVEDANFAKIELVARNFAETGFRELYEGVIWLAQHYQDESTEIRVLGKPLIVNPAEWKHEHYCFSQVGLGAGDSSEMLANLSGMMAIVEKLIARGSVLADDQKLYNILDDMVGIIGKPDTTRYFNNPEIPATTLFAQNQIMVGQILALQQQIQQNPLAEAELIKARAKLVEAQGKGEQSMREFIMEFAQENKQFAETLAKDLTELELKYGRNVPGALV